MSRWKYNADYPPPKPNEVVEGAVALLKSADLLSGTLYLGSNESIYAHEEPVTKPQRWVLVVRFQQLAGQVVDPAGLLKVELQVKVVGEREMPNYARWHDAMHDRIERSLIGMSPQMASSRSETGFRLTHERTRPEYYADTDTRESFARYAINLESLQPS